MSSRKCIGIALWILIPLCFLACRKPPSPDATQYYQLGKDIGAIASRLEGEIYNNAEGRCHETIGAAIRSIDGSRISQYHARLFSPLGRVLLSSDPSEEGLTIEDLGYQAEARGDFASTIPGHAKIVKINASKQCTRCHADGEFLAILDVSGKIR